VNGKMVPLDYELKNGDIVDVLTSNTARPSKDWLNVVKSPHARAKIKAYFKNEERQDDYKKGHDTFSEYYNTHIKEVVKFYETAQKSPFVSAAVAEKHLPSKEDLELSRMLKSKIFNDAVESLGFKSIDDFWVIIGRGEYQIKNIFAKLFPEYAESLLTKNKPLHIMQKKAPEKKSRSINGVIVAGLDDVLVRFSKCCSPVPGDPIIGFITRGRGVSIHRKNCGNIAGENSAEGRVIEVIWDSSRLSTHQINYATRLRIKAVDRHNLIFNVTNLIANLKLNIYEFHARVEKSLAIIEFTIDINNIKQLEDIIRNLEKVDGVTNVYRIESGGSSGPPSPPGK